MLVTELIHRVKFHPSHGLASISDKLEDPFIYSVCLSFRNKLLTEEAKKKQKISPWLYQTIPCIEMKKCSISECSGCLPVGDCLVYRSVNKLPKVLTDDKKPLIESITSMDGSTVINIIDWNAVQNIDESKWGNKKTFGYIDNEYLYVRSNGNITNGLRMKALFDDPIKAITFPSLCNNNPLINQNDPCQSYYDMEFYSEDDRTTLIVEMANQYIYNFYMKTQSDDQTEGRDKRQI